MIINIFFIISLFLFSCSSTIEKSTDDIVNGLWSSDLDELDIVMFYIMDDSNEYKIIKKLDKEQKILYIKNYFSKLDPDISTIGNESLDELNKRVLACKRLFLGFDGGILSDRSRIYIIYGPPQNIIEKKINNSNFITWNYIIENKIVEFNFLLDKFERYKLIN
jgi:GWxTD domain-containing protein|tara:strand:+ start:883 stop:1374 length:492 start_codon:yes stop_codon:yes gene_type:complete